MSLRRSLWLAGAVLVWTCAGVRGQVVMPLSAPDTATDGGCPSFNSGTTSAASQNCKNAERSQNSMDGGKHLLLSLGSIGGYDSAFNARRNLRCVVRRAASRTQGWST